MIADLDFLYETGSPAAAAAAAAAAAEGEGEGEGEGESEGEVVGIADSIAQDGLFKFQLSSGYHISLPPTPKQIALFNG